MSKNRTPHIIAIVSVVIFIVCGADAAQTQTASPYFTGDGGRGRSIAILAPQARGLAENQNYLPALVQGELVNNFSTYSAISVLDRVNLDEQYAELLSGYYTDNAQESWDLGHLPPTTYLMGGNITRTSTGYALQMRISRNTDKMTVASYSGTCTFEELDNLSGVRQASLDLLQKMGVEPTGLTRTELTGAAASNNVNAQAALARGITAQRQGTEVAALSYYFQAAAIDPSLLEAANRSSVMSTNISSGNIGQDVRNDIAWRTNWVQRLTEAEQSFAEFNKTQSMPYTLFYSDGIAQGTANYQNETVTLSIETNLHPSHAWRNTVGVSMQQTLRAVYDGLQATKRTGDWGLQGWPRQGVTNLNSFMRRSSSFAIDVELLDEQNRAIGRQSFRRDGWWEYTYNGNVPDGVRISDDVRSTVSFTVKANDISDRLSIRIARVNGVDAETAARNGVLHIQALTKDEYDRNVKYSSNNLFDFARGEIKGYTENERSVVIPGAIWGEPVASIVRSAFSSNQLTSVTILNGVTTIGNAAFSNNQLQSVTIPDSVTTIGVGAFAKNRLTSVTLSNNVTSISDNAFSDNQLRNVTIPNSVTSIGEWAFSPNQLTSVTIPDSVTSIGLGAFMFNQLTSVTIPDSVRSIGDSAFAFNQLTSITIPAGVTSIGGSAFSGCTSLTNVTIPAGVTSIEAWTFFRCSSLTSVTIPVGVTAIEDGAFSWCSSLTGITVDNQNRAYTSVEGILFNKNRTVLMQYPAGKQGRSYTIPAGVTAIGNYAFTGCTSLTTVTIPASVTSIGHSAFYNCIGLTGLTIPSSVTSIGTVAFFGCDGLSSAVRADIEKRFGSHTFWTQ